MDATVAVSHDGIGYLLAAVIAFVLAQGIKFFLNHRAMDAPEKASLGELFESGRMPSSHTAVVIAFASSILFTEGVSKLFAFAAVFAMVTIYDSLVVRRSSGEQGTALLKLISKSPFSKDPLPYVALGHKPLEVTAGAALGLAVGIGVAIFIT